MPLQQTAFWKHYKWQKKKLLKTSNFSFCTCFPLLVIGDFLFFSQNLFKVVCCRIVVWGKGLNKTMFINCKVFYPFLTYRRLIQTPLQQMTFDKNCGKRGSCTLWPCNYAFCLNVFNSLIIIHREFLYLCLCFFKVVCCRFVVCGKGFIPCVIYQNVWFILELPIVDFYKNVSHVV